MYTGAILEDNRTEEQKAKDYNSLELGLGQKTVWREIDIDNYTHPAFPNGVKEQGDSTCGSHTQANAMQVIEYKETGNSYPLSCAMPYLYRAGTYEGTSIQDVMDTIRKNGTTYEMFMPSDKASDEKVLSYKPTSTDIAIGEVLSVETTFRIGSFDLMCEYLESSRINGLCNPAMVLSRLGSGDWQKVVTDTGSAKIYGHWYLAVDYGTIKGVEGIVVADSAMHYSTNKYGFRFVPRDYLYKWANAYVGVTDKQNAIGGVKAEPTNTYNLKAWTFGDTDCQELQRFLSDKGFFPKTQSQTGYYGNITAGSVKKWQIANNVASLATINKYEGKYFGPASLRVANQLLK